MEMAKCKICGNDFTRIAKKYNPKSMCDNPKCHKINSLKWQRPVNFKGIPGKCSIYTAKMDYEGDGYHL